MLEDAVVLADTGALGHLFEDDAVLVTGDGRTFRGAAGIVKALAAAILLGWSAQDPEALRAKLGDVELVGDWIYDDVPAGFARAEKTGKPLAVFLRCVP